MTHSNSSRVRRRLATLGMLLLVGMALTAAPSAALAQGAPGVSSSYAARAAVFDPYGMAGAYVPPGDRTHRQYFADQRGGQASGGGRKVASSPGRGVGKKSGGGGRGLAALAGRAGMVGMGPGMSSVMGGMKTSSGKYGGARP